MKQRKSFTQAWSPFSPRHSSSLLLLTCKNCKHEYLNDISKRGYEIMDLAIRSRENYKKFWKERFECPKCKSYTPPVVLILDTNPDGIWKEWDSIKTTDENWVSPNKDLGKMIILDDWKGCLPPIKKMKKSLDSMKKYCSEFSISLPKTTKSKTRKNKK